MSGSVGGGGETRQPMKSSQSSHTTESIVDEADESAASESLSEGQLYDFITNQPVQDSPVERTLQTVARSLVDEYGFDHTQLARDQSLAYELIDGDGKARKVRQRVSVAVFPEGSRKTDPSQIIRACLVQPPTTKANDPKRGVDLLEQVMGALPACDYGLWTNGTDLIFKQKLTGGGACSRSTWTSTTSPATAKLQPTWTGLIARPAGSPPVTTCSALSPASTITSTATRG